MILQAVRPVSSSIARILELLLLYAMMYFAEKIDSRLIQIDQLIHSPGDSIVSNSSFYVMNLYQWSHALSQCSGTGPANIYSTPFSTGTRAGSSMDIDTSKLGRLDTKEAEQL